VKKDAIVVDLDGTLANIDHRLHLVSGKRKDFDAFYAGVGEDSVNEWCRLIMTLFEKQGFKVIIVSARRQNTEAATRAWLNDNNIKYSRLELLRPDGDSTPDQDLKCAWLKSYGADKILFVIDDRTKVVNMWREEGVTCFQCSRWEDRKFDPQTVEIVAEECHRQWSNWTEHLLSKLKNAVFPGSDWQRVMPTVWESRWKRQIATPYDRLSEEEKGADRREALRILDALEKNA
jgi:hypothetical protein